MPAAHYEDANAGLIRRAFRDVKADFYVDFRAGGLDTDSVTETLHDDGWRGVVIAANDPTNGLPRAPRAGDVTLLVDAGGAPGGFQAKVGTLADICLRYGQRQVHLVRIDVKGPAISVLEGADLARVRPWVVLVVVSPEASGPPRQQGLESLLSDANYYFIASDKRTRLYLASERLATLGGALLTKPLRSGQLGPSIGFEQDRTFDAVEAAISGYAAGAKASRERVFELEGSAALARLRALEARADLIELRRRPAKVEFIAGDGSEELARLRRSRSWRLTAPLRALVHAARGDMSVALMELGQSPGRLQRIKAAAGADGSLTRRVGRSALYALAKALQRHSGAAAAYATVARWLPGPAHWLRCHRDSCFAAAEAAEHRPKSAPGGDDRYERWIAENEAVVHRDMDAPPGFGALPKVAVLVQVPHGPDAEALQATLASLAAQTDGRWTCIVAGQQSTRSVDERVGFLPSAVCRSGSPLNDLLAAATTPYVVILDAGDVLAPTAMASIDAELLEPRDPDLLYADEDRIGWDGRRCDPAFKPSWSPELLTSYNYIGRPAVLRRAAVLAAGGFDAALGPAAEWDMLLRLMGPGATCRRIPKVLCHRPIDGPSERPAGSDPRSGFFREALRQHWARRGFDAMVRTSADGSQRASWPIPRKPLVSIVILSKNQPELLRVCVTGLLLGTAYEPREIIIVDNESTDPATLALYDELSERPGVRILPFVDPYNTSAACNAGARIAAGELLLFLNNAIEIGDPEWLEEMVRWAIQPGVGVVGTKLVSPGGGLQHAGVVVGVDVCGLAFCGAEPGTWGVFGSPDTPRNYLAVVGACQLVVREVFEAVGGFDETYGLSNGDVALCLRAWKAGYRVVYTPYAELTLREGATHGNGSSAEDLARTATDLRALGIADDPYFHPGLNSRLRVPTLRLSPDCPVSVRIARDAERLLKPYPAALPLDLRSGGTDALGRLPAMPAPGDVVDRWSAARFCIATLRADPVLRARFPRALSDGVEGGFAAWLHGEGRERFGFSAAASGLLDGVLADPPGARVKQVCLMLPDVLARFPLGFLPDGQGGLLAWLFDEGVAEHDLRPEDIGWFALECAEDPARQLMFTWSMRPDWQRLFPEGITRFGRVRFARWLVAVFGLSEALANADAWPDDLSAAQQLRIAWHLRPDWQRRFPAALDDDGAARAFLAWLCSDLSGLEPGVRLWCRGLERDSTARALAERGVNVFGHFAYPSGLRTSVDSLVVGLRHNGHAVSLRNVPVDRRKDEPAHWRFTGLEEYPVSLVHVQPEPFFLRCQEISGVFPPAPRRYRIGYWYWEMDTVPASWTAATEQVDEIWAATRFVADALRTRFDIPVLTIPPGFDIAPVVPSPRSRFGIPEGCFAFLFVFHMTSIIDRKNPLGLIRAFARAFRREEPAVLVIKTTFGESHPAKLRELRDAAAQTGLEIIVIDEVYTQADTLALMAACDAYVSLHRSEGLGITMAEAMLLGKPVIATGYSGNVDFMNGENSMLVDYRLVPIGDMIPPYEPQMRWAYPSEEHAARSMRRLFDDRAFALALGAQGRRDLRQNHGTAAAGRRMAERLAELRAERALQARCRDASSGSKPNGQPTA